MVRSSSLLLLRFSCARFRSYRVDSPDGCTNAVFKAFYVTGLAKRLLLGKSASDDAEMGMVERLKKGQSHHAPALSGGAGC
jgi:hypothetical protein